MSGITMKLKICKFSLIFILISIIHSGSSENSFLAQLKVNPKNAAISSSLKPGEMLHCDISKYAPDEPTLKYKVEKTKKSNVFTFYDITKSQSDKHCVSFGIKAQKEVTLSVADADKRHMLEIFLGLGNLDNKYSKIRLILPDGKLNDSRNFETKDILSEYHYHQFWCKWTKNRLTFGKLMDREPLMEYNIDDMFNVKYVGIRSAINDAEWIFMEPDCPGYATENEDQVLLTKCEKIESSDTSKEDRLQRILLKEMQLDLDNFKRIPEYRKTKSFLERSRLELEENYSKAKQYHEKLLLNIMDEKHLNDYVEDEIFSKIKTIFFEHFSLLQEEIKEGYSLPAGMFHEYNYTINPALNRGHIFFNTTGFTYSLNVNLFETKNHEKIAIEIDRSDSKILYTRDDGVVKEKMGHTTPAVNFSDSAEGHYGFWIQIKNGTVLVGRKDESEEFLKFDKQRSYEIDAVSFFVPKQEKIIGFQVRYD